MFSIEPLASKYCLSAQKDVRESVVFGALVGVDFAKRRCRGLESMMSTPGRLVVWYKDQ